MTLFQNDEDNRKDFAVSAKRSVGSLKFGQETGNLHSYLHSRKLFFFPFTISFVCFAFLFATRPVRSMRLEVFSIA